MISGIIVIGTKGPANLPGVVGGQENKRKATIFFD